jgi:valyl-tRNA synthetase
MQELVRAVREVRNRYMVDPKTGLEVFVRCSEQVAGDFRKLEPFITSLACVSRLECGPDVVKQRQAASHVDPAFEVYVSLQGLIDVDKEIQRLEKQLAEKRKFLQATQAKLNNPNFLKNAPPEVVQQQHGLLADLQSQLQVLDANLHELQKG